MLFFTLSSWILQWACPVLCKRATQLNNDLRSTYHVLGPMLAVIQKFQDTKNFSQMWKIQHFYGLRGVPIFRSYFSYLHVLVWGIHSVLLPMFTKNELLISIVSPHINTTPRPPELNCAPRRQDGAKMLPGQHLPTAFGWEHTANMCIFNHCTWTSKNDFSFNNWIEGLGLTSTDPVFFFSKRLQSFCHNLEGYSAFNTQTDTFSNSQDHRHRNGPRARRGLISYNTNRKTSTFFILGRLKILPFSFLSLSPCLLLMVWIFSNTSPQVAGILFIIFLCKVD